MLKFGAKLIAPARVESVTPSIDPSAPHLIHLDCGAKLKASCVLIATGVRWRKLPALGADRFEGTGIHYACTSVEAMVYNNRDVAVIGAGNSAGQAAMYLAENSRGRKVRLLIRKHLGPGMSDYLVGRLKAKTNSVVHEDVELAQVHGERQISHITLRNCAPNRAAEGLGTDVTLRVSAIFVFIGAEPGCSWLPADIARDDLGYLLSGADARDSGRWPLTFREPCPLVPGILV